MKSYELKDVMTEKQTVLEDDGKDWPTKKLRMVVSKCEKKYC